MQLRLSFGFQTMVVHPLLDPSFNNSAAFAALMTFDPSASPGQSMAGVDAKAQVEVCFINWAGQALLVNQLLELLLAAFPGDPLPTKPAPKVATLQNPSMPCVALH